MPNENDPPKMLTRGLEGITVIYKISSASSSSRGGGAPVYAGSSSDGFGGEPGAGASDGGGDGAPSPTSPQELTEIVTEVATDPEAIALQERLRNGEGTPDEALTYFQEHGFPWLTTLPTWDENMKKWLFPEGSLPVGVSPDSSGKIGFGISPGAGTGHSSTPSGQSTTGSNSSGPSDVSSGLPGLGSGEVSSSSVGTSGGDGGGGGTGPGTGPDKGTIEAGPTGDDSVPLFGTHNFRVDPALFQFQPESDSSQLSRCVTFGMVYLIDAKPVSTPILLHIKVRGPRFKGGQQIDPDRAARISAAAVAAAAERLEESLNLGLTSPAQAQRQFQLLTDAELRSIGGPAWSAFTCG